MSTSPPATTRWSRRWSPAKDSKVATAKSVKDLKAAKLGAAIGTTSLDYIDDVIKADAKAQVFDDNAAAKAAFDAKQVDGIVFDLPTAYYITAVEIPDAVDRRRAAPLGRAGGVGHAVRGRLASWCPA